MRDGTRARARGIVALAVAGLLLAGGAGAWTQSSRSAADRAAALRRHWQGEVRDGVPAAAIEPLQLRLDAAERARVAGVPMLVADPLAAQGLLGDLERETALVYRRSLDASLQRAAAARDRLLHALGDPAAAAQIPGDRELASGRTPAALDALAEGWDLEAAMVPTDRAVTDRLAALAAVAQRARAAGVSDAPAADLDAQVRAYEQLDARRRRPAAGPLLEALDRARLQVGARIDDARGLGAAPNAAAQATGCPTDVLALLNRRTAPLSPGCAPGFRAQPALDRMLAAMRAGGLHPTVVSTYRSYQTQAALYRSRVQAFGAVRAGEFTAPPGYSEHQLGLAVDLASAAGGGQLSSAFDATPEGAWLRANAARYGFILRYPAGKEAITGYGFEAWHFRYVGTAATAIPAGTTLEEYLQRTG
jgi:hypothetical protein